MLQALGKIAGSVLRSLFISIVMFIIVFSVITGEFPPNFKRVTNTFKNLQQMTQLSRQIQEQQKALKNQYTAHGEVDENDVEALQELNLKRAELGAGLLQAENAVSDSQETSELKQKMKELETQLFRLQQRVSQLESKTK
ncbi:hypothetical protein [Bdellovibrio bacteriovorus]|uniref:hypothetical protein n=1 Tax=Bdellovibrio bacteriovorus TaxID=959 RepID=UPI0035A68965